jgi:hypothetical protein
MQPNATMHARTTRRTVFGAIAGLVLAISPALAQDAVFPINSRIGLKPLPGFVASTKFAGFENPGQSAAILVADLPAEAFPELEKGFTDEMLKARGMTVEKRQPLTFKDGRGFYVAGPKEINGARQHETVMVANIAGATTIVSVQMIEPTRAVLTDAVVAEMLKTVAVRRDVPQAERLAVLPYKMNELSGFRIVRSGQDGNAILTEGPNDAVEGVTQPFVVIGVSTGEVPKPEERDKFARRMFSTAPGVKDIKITRAEALRLGQSPAHEIIADAKDAKTGTDVTTVQWLRFGQNSNLVMFGIVRKQDWNNVYPRLRAIRDGVEPK